MTLSALATSARCSESLLSKIENGKHFPSLPMMGRIAQALDIPMGALLGSHGDQTPVVHRRRPRPSETALDVSVVVETPAFDTGLVTARCGILHIASGRASAIEAHEAGDETGIVLEGCPSLIINGRAHALDIGDAFAFRAEQMHGYANPGSTQARIFRVYTRSTVAP